MKHVSNFNNWHSANQLNESLILTVQAGIVIGLLGIKGIIAIVRKVAQKLGENVELEKSELKDLVGQIMDDIQKADKSGKSFSALEKELNSKIESGEITKARDIVTVIKDLTK
jgi:hypothetical protein